MMNFGFSYLGLIFLLMLFIPNMMWSQHKPQNYEQFVDHEKKIDVFFERAGEVAVTCSVLIFEDPYFHMSSFQNIFLLLAIILIVFYELYWIRYFKSHQTMQDFYSSFLCFSVDGASLPVFAFFCLGIYKKNIFVLLATVLLGIGHIPIHLQHKKEIK